MKKGVYCLQVYVNREQHLCIGSLGLLKFPKGYYIYVGSALGSGGLSRVCRHIAFYQHPYRNPKWHIDYLTLHATLEKTYCTQTEERIECQLAAAIGGDYVPHFGCSDCDCNSHLYYRKESPESDIKSAFSQLGFPVIEHTVERYPKQIHRS